MIRRCEYLVAVALSAATFLVATAGRAQPLINEVLFNPPGTDAPNQYLELRGTPNSVLSNGTYFLAVEGNAGANPGTIRNLFDLSGLRFGGNGFLALLQKTNSYPVSAGAMVLTHAGWGEGFGSGDDSTIGHTGTGGQTDLEGPSVTYLLIQTTNPPATGEDLDGNNDGVPDASWFQSWTVFDSIGILDNSGVGDFAYGRINFRRNDGAQAPGVVIPVPFTPDYVARNGNTSGSGVADWVAANDLVGAAPYWELGGSSDTFPPSQAERDLDNIGGPNFGALHFPGVLVTPNNQALQVVEGGNAIAYRIALNTMPAGPVTLSLSADSQVEISTDGGSTYGGQRLMALSSLAEFTVLVRAVDDRLVEPSPHRAWIMHSVTTTSDALNYPLSTPIPGLPVDLTDNDDLLLNELKANPPGEDAGFEYVEILGEPGLRLEGVYFLAIESSLERDPGKVQLSISLGGYALGTSGLLVMAASNHPYSFAPGTAFYPHLAFNQTNAALPNGVTSFLLVASPSPILADEDLDKGDNGKLEGLPAGTTILDAVGFDRSPTNSVMYGGGVLRLVQGIPDAASRYPHNLTPANSNCWFYGQLFGAEGATLQYHSSNTGPDFPYGALLTPGAPNRVPFVLSRISPLCGAIGDPTNPKVPFSVTARETNLAAVTVTVASSNPQVVPNANLILTTGAPGNYILTINPVGVGYANITLTAGDGTDQARLSFEYAASAMGRAGGRFHGGAADASTAIPLDANWMLVGDDENQVLRLFSRQNSGAAVWQTNLTPFLGLTDFENGVPREVDIEASTRVGNRLYWMGAHSHANRAEGRTNRSRIFTTAISGSGTNIDLAYLGRYDYLKLDLVNWDAGNGHGKGADYYGLYGSTAEGVDPKSPGGFNIEGLAMAPGSDTTAYVCLRAPIVPAANRTHALIVPVLNFTTLAASDGPLGSAQFGQPIELDLFGRGVRSIEGDGQGYLIIAGTPLNTPGPYPDDFKLYTWTGNAGDRPQQLDTDLSGMNPEGIAELPPRPWGPTSPVQIISDNGVMDWYGDGTQAKWLPVREFRKFRSDWMTLGNATSPAPIVKSIVRSSQSVTIRWRSSAGIMYQVQYKNGLHDPVWTSLSGAVTATGTETIKVDDSPQPQRFYRVIVP